jgi:hypothetical protein
MAYVARYGHFLSKTLEIKISSGKWKEIDVQDIIVEINNAYSEIFSIVMDVSKRYSIDIVLKGEKELEIPEIRVGGRPISQLQQGQKPVP